MNTIVDSSVSHAVETRGYQSGFGNEFATEALPGALPPHQNSPQPGQAGQSFR